MNHTTALTTVRKPAFTSLVRAIRTFTASERETLEMLLDGAFTRTTLRRGKDVSVFRKAGKLLSLDEVRKTFRA